MAAGDGNLPYDTETVDPFDVVLSATQNEHIANIKALADGSGIGDGAITFDKTTGIWWEEIGRTTLGSAGDIITVSALPARRYLRVIIYAIPTGGTINTIVRLNNDSGNNYSRRRSVNSGAADATAASNDQMVTHTPTNGFHLVTFDLSNLENQEKLAHGLMSITNGAGASNLPDRVIFTGKWANTSSQVNRIDVSNSGTGDYAAGSEVVVLGHD